jgi:hypothetical protein
MNMSPCLRRRAATDSNLLCTTRDNPVAVGGAAVDVVGEMDSVAAAVAISGAVVEDAVVVAVVDQVAAQLQLPLQHSDSISTPPRDVGISTMCA